MSKNFKLIRKNVDVSFFCEELANFLQLGGSWSAVRSDSIDVQRETRHIDIRRVVLGKPMAGMSPKDLLSEASNSEHHELHFKNYPYFIKTYDFLEKFADEIGGQVTRAMIVSLNPNSKVYKHIDWGSYYVSKDRYHLPIKTKGSINRCNGEEQVYLEGELWWFDNKKEHEAFNQSNEERIHIIFDILPKKRSLVQKIKDSFEKKMSCLAQEIRLSQI